MFKNCLLVTTEAYPDQYRGQDAKPGEPGFVLSGSDLLEFAKCPSRWVAAQGELRRVPGKWRSLLECLHLTPHQHDKRFAVRPDAYTVTLNKCPVCKSASAAAICRKCGQRRRPEVVQKPWAAAADYCAKWQEAQDKKRLTTVRTEERHSADAALARLAADPAIAEFRDASKCQLWVRGDWLDDATGLQIPLRALIGYWPAKASPWGDGLGFFRTPRDAGHGSWTRACYYAGYHTRAALALDLYNVAADDERRQAYFVLSEAGPPHEPARRQLAKELIALGRKSYQALIRQYAQCLKTRTWPTYDLNAAGPEAWTVVGLEPWMESGYVDAVTQPAPDAAPDAISRTE
jgi:hypothetical protein